MKVLTSCLLGLSLATGAIFAAGERPPVHIVLVGDSTVTDKAGWGKAFADRLVPGVTCTNTSSGGQSTKSFLDGGRCHIVATLPPTPAK